MTAFDQPHGDVRQGRLRQMMAFVASPVSPVLKVSTIKVMLTIVFFLKCSGK